MTLIQICHNVLNLREGFERPNDIVFNTVSMILLYIDKAFCEMWTDWQPYLRRFKQQQQQHQKQKKKKKKKKKKGEEKYFERKNHGYSYKNVDILCQPACMVVSQLWLITKLPSLIRWRWVGPPSK